MTSPVVNELLCILFNLLDRYGGSIAEILCIGESLEGNAVGGGFDNFGRANEDAQQPALCVPPQSTNGFIFPPLEK